MSDSPRDRPILISLWKSGWDSINRKKAPFASNPWVWVVEFARVK